ncbi:MAG: trypsin-like peptidase domain-containing protein [Bacteroidales bacterium]|nr:trypsin-like peptidase domain-containing protein [Bacteroidales bacterium]
MFNIISNMNLRWSLTFFLIALTLLSFIGCRQSALQKAIPVTHEDQYHSELPIKMASVDMDQIAGSVKKLFCIVEYDVYHFDESDKMNREKLSQINLKRSNARRTAFNESVHGTATVLQNNRYGMVLLTCAHIVSNPDTVISFYASNSREGIIESIAIKKTQMNFIRDNETNILLRILAIDQKPDVAFLGSDSPSDAADVQAFRYLVGNANALHWGTPVYLMGFPGGHQMLTRAVVGNPNPSTSGDFIVDATFNPGGSGSLILALSENDQLFELVGIAKSASATFSNIIRPEKESHQETYNPNLPYEGDLFVTRVKNINYGVTFATSINTIRDFYIQHRKSLTREGYNLDEFFSLK